MYLLGLHSKFSYVDLTADIGTALSERYTIVGTSISLITKDEIRNNEQIAEQASAMVQKILEKKIMKIFFFILRIKAYLPTM